MGYCKCLLYFLSKKLMNSINKPSKKLLRGLILKEIGESDTLKPRWPTLDNISSQLRQHLSAPSCTSKSLHTEVARLKNWRAQAFTGMIIKSTLTE
ncbi:MAG: hypothetical protein D3925_16400 [Candidatus Electrothrix sp. AR5]|nr:hypothetical protein [Candidatus Electrothrix sp. AR5]